MVNHHHGAILHGHGVARLKHKLLRSDNVVSEDARKEGRTLEGLGIEPVLVEAILPSYLVRYRPQGQFTKIDRTA